MGSGCAPGLTLALGGPISHMDDQFLALRRYATMILRRSPSDLDGTFAVLLESPPHGKRAGFAVSARAW